MVMAYYDYMLSEFGQSQDLTDFVTQAFSALETEYAWWMNNDNRHSQLFIIEGSFYWLNHY